MWWDEHSILSLIDAWKPDRPQRVWLDTGTAEGSNPGKVVADARLMRDALGNIAQDNGIHMAVLHRHFRNGSFRGKFHALADPVIGAGPAQELRERLERLEAEPEIAPIASLIAGGL